MSTHRNGSGRKRKLKPRHPRLVPLLMLGSGGETIPFKVIDLTG